MMWERVCKCYDDVSLSVESCLTKLHQMKHVKENDHRALVQLVDMTEGVYFQLLELNQLACLSMLDVDRVSEALPPTVTAAWNKVYHTLPEYEKLQPFSSFMSFLSNVCDIVHRLAEKTTLWWYTKELEDRNTLW